VDSLAALKQLLAIDVVNSIKFPRIFEISNEYECAFDTSKYLKSVDKSIINYFLNLIEKFPKINEIS